MKSFEFTKNMQKKKVEADESPYFFPLNLSPLEERKLRDFCVLRGLFLPDGVTIVSPERLQDFINNREFQQDSQTFSMIGTVLLDAKVLVTNQEDNKKNELTPAIAIPRSIDQLLSGESEGVVGIEKIIKSQNSLSNKIIQLEDGTLTTVKEIKFIKAFHSLKPLRLGDGTLTIIDPEKRTRVPFTFKIFATKLTDFGLSAISKISARELLRTYLPVVFSKGLINDMDIKVSGRTETGILFGAKDKNFKTKNGGSKFFSYVHDGVSLYYFLGRKKVAGTDIQIDPEKMILKQLDAHTIGIVQNSGFSSKIIATMKLLDKQEALEFRQKVKERLQEKNPEEEISNEKVSKHSVLPLSTVAKKISLYDSETILPEYIRTAPYYNEVREAASNPQFVIEEFRKTLRDNNIGYMDLSWKQQVLLTTIVKKQYDEKVVVDFIREYKTTGLKVFLSFLHGGKEMGEKILELGDTAKFPKETAEKIFEKYSMLVDSTEHAQLVLQQLLPTGQVVANEQLTEISTALMTRAKNMLVRFADMKGGSVVELLPVLDRYNEGIILFAETYKSFAHSGQKIDLEQARDTEIRVLSTEERVEHAEMLWEITRENRKDFITSKEAIEKRELRFRATLVDPDVIFYDLEYKDNIVGFTSFEPQNDGTYLVESLNVESEIKSTRVGGDFFRIVVEKMSYERPLVGYVHEQNKQTLTYYERIGFRVDAVEKEGVVWYRITFPKQDQVK